MKHAYMIMAHNQKEQLKILLELLDSENNDLYIHIDAKSDMDGSGLDEVVKKAGLYVFKKYKIYWADVSQTRCQFYLLREALKTHHDYYHLISGSDLPLMTNQEIDAFFEKNKGKQLINFDGDGPSMNPNCRFRHYLRPVMQRCKRGSKGYKWCRKLDMRLVKRQQEKGYSTGFSRGCNWNSVTEELAKDYVRYEAVLLKQMRFTLSSDESVLQTYVRKYHPNWEMVGDDRDYDGSVFRKIDWARGGPYVWREGDYEELMNSGLLFARKFDAQVDEKIILKIRDTLLFRQRGERMEGDAE